MEYESSLNVNPTIRNFWKNLKKNSGEFHVFKKNKNLVFFADDLSRSSFEFIANRIEKLKTNSSEVEACFLSILKKESTHTTKLVELAKKAVFESFMIPEDILDCNLNLESSVELNSTEEKFDNNCDYDSLDKSLKDQINKRILLNCVIQGASIHSFYTMHHIVKNELNELDSELVDLYDKFSTGSVFSYFRIDYSSILEDEILSVASALGSSKIEQQEDDLKVVVNAKSFPVLCQEIVKGSLETICLHGLKDISKEDLQKIYYFSDKRVDEPRYIQIGSEIWRKLLGFLKYYNKEDKIQIPDFVMKISMLETVEIENFFEHVFQGEYDEAKSYF